MCVVLKISDIVVVNRKDFSLNLDEHLLSKCKFLLWNYPLKIAEVYYLNFLLKLGRLSIAENGCLTE